MEKQIKYLDIMTKCKIKDKDYEVVCHLTDDTVVIDDKKEYTMIPNDTSVTVCD